MTTSADYNSSSYQQHATSAAQQDFPVQHRSPPKDDIEIPTPGTTSTRSGRHSAIPPLDKASTKRYLEAYLNSAAREFTVFLHKPTVFADWGKGRIDASLLKVLTALGWQTTQPEQSDLARIWLQEAQYGILKTIGRTSISQLQVLVLLTQYHVRVGDNADAWNLLPLAARIAFTLRLNHEREDLEIVERETRRRLAWAIYELDRFFCGGIPDLAVFLPEMMHIRLPCDEQSFQRGVASRAGFLTDDGNQDNRGMNIQAFVLRQLATRDRVLKSILPSPFVFVYTR